MSENNAKIYVLHYKKGPVLKLPSLYSPLMAGNSLLHDQSEMIGDDTDNNISAKNRYYSELTGIYWIWKNRQSEITGACHYRRFFTAHPEPLLYQLKRLSFFLIGLHRKRHGIIYTSNVNIFIERILSETELQDILKEHDALLPVARKLKYSVEEHYRRYHDANDLVILKKIISERHPEFTAAFEKVLQSKRLYANNMFVLRKNHFEEFMTWWFDILFEFERQIDLQTKTGYQQRILGFIAERLLNVWFAYKQLNVVELPIIYFKKFKDTGEFKV